MIVRPGRDRRFSGQRSAIQQILALGPAMWLRFDASHVTLNATKISGAADLSANARNASQTTDSLRPLIVSPVGADFDGTDDYMALATAFLNGAASTSCFTVFDLAGEVLSQQTVFGHGGAAGQYSIGINADTAGTNGLASFAVQINSAYRRSEVAGTLSGQTGRFLIDARAVSGSVITYKNGVAGAEDTTAWTTTIQANDTPYVGAAKVGGAAVRFFPGTVLDVLVFVPALSAAQQSAVRTLLARLEGVTIS